MQFNMPAHNNNSPVSRPTPEERRPDQEMRLAEREQKIMTAALVARRERAIADHGGDERKTVDTLL